MFNENKSNSILRLISIITLIIIVILFIWDLLTSNPYESLTINPLNVDWRGISFANIDVNSLIQTLLSALIGFLLTIIVIEIILKKSRDKELNEKRRLQFNNVSKVVKAPLYRYKKAALSISYPLGKMPIDMKIKIPIDFKVLAEAFMPQQFADAWTTLIGTESTIENGAWLFAGYILVYLLIIIFVTLINTAERRIPIQYTSSSIQLSKRSESNYLPLKVNSASVIPVIFASSLMMAPLQIASFFPTNDIIRTMQDWLGLQTWYSLVIYVLLILFFTFFYTKMQINPEKISENLGKSGAYIPSVRPGTETKNYVNKVLSRITVLGSICLALIAVLPHIMPLIWTDMPTSMALGGTGMIIVVGVAIETVRQVQGLITQKSYKKYFED